MLVPARLTAEQKAVFIHKAGPYTLIQGVLHKMGKDLRLRRCLEVSEIPKVISALHEDAPGGHFAVDSTVKKILDTGYWWPTMFKDVCEYMKSCDPCQRVGKPSFKTHWPLTPILPLAPFEKWGIDFIGLIKPATSVK